MRRAAYLGIAVLAAATACGSATVSSGPGAPADITVAALPIVANAQVYIARQQGLFAKQGLHVTIKNVVQTPAATADMVHGSVDTITGANLTSFFEAQDSGVLDIRIVAEQSTCTPGSNLVVVLPHSPIIKPAQLATATIAVNVLNSVQSMTINEVLASEGVPTDHIHYVVVPFATMATALAAHRVDAAAEVEPFLEEAYLSDGVRDVLDGCQGPTSGIPLAGSVATAQWVRQNPGTARRFEGAMDQAAVMANTDRAIVTPLGLLLGQWNALGYSSIGLRTSWGPVRWFDDVRALGRAHEAQARTTAWE
jgi:NitT/TauT family transport system substrate-binding protein